MADWEDRIESWVACMAEMRLYKSRMVGSVGGAGPAVEVEGPVGTEDGPAPEVCGWDSGGDRGASGMRMSPEVGE